MTQDLVTAGPDVSVGDAMDLLDDQRVRHLPVVADGRLLGMVSDRALREYRLPLKDALEAPDRAQALADTPLREAMQPSVVIVSPDAELDRAIDLMLTEQVGALPVVDRSGALVGILTHVDVLQWVRDSRGS